MKINKQQLKALCLLVIILNLISACLGVIYYSLQTRKLFWLWNLQGSIMFASWFLNILLVYINDRMLMKKDPIGRKINNFCYYSLVFMIIAMLLFFYHNLTISFISALSIVNIALPLMSLIEIAIFSVVLAYFDIKYLENQGVWKFE